MPVVVCLICAMLKSLISMPEITNKDLFGQSIIKVLKTFNIESFLEIGSWDGTGSTACIIEGFSNSKNRSLTCLEINKERFSDLVKNTSQYPWIKCHNESSISYHSLFYRDFEDVWNSPYNGLPRQWNPKEVVKGWFERDVEEMKKIEFGFLERNKDFYDAVLIDGGEFTGYSEYLLLKDRTNFFLLDDVFHAFKTKQVADELLRDKNWQMLTYDQNTRNGFMIFKRNQ